MSGCGNCCGNCGSCNELILAEGEIALLRKLGQIPFLPVARRMDEDVPVYLEDDQYSQEEYSLILQCLEKRGLISTDYEKPLSGADYTAYSRYPLKGSIALTLRGQQVLDLLEIQGV